MKKMKQKEMLIDGDILIYKIALQSERPVKWDDNMWTLHAFEDEAVANVDDGIKRIQRKLGVKPYRVALTSSKNFRKDVLPSYKSNRVGVRKPMILPALRQHMLDNHDAIIIEGLEADDVLGILATEKSNKKDSIIVSVDKDFKQIPTKICLDGETVQIVTEDMANHWFMIQVLMGDATDGYTGLPGCGIKTAEKILGPEMRPLDELWDIVVEAYAKKGYTEKEALQQARVAKILRAEDYNEDKGEVKLWQIKR